MSAETEGPVLLEGAHTLTRRSLLRLLDDLETRFAGGVEVALLPPGETPGEGWAWLPDAALASEAGLVLFRGQSFDIAVTPPFPLALSSAGGRAAPLGLLRDLLLRKRLIAVVLLRLGAYAVGVLYDGHLVLSKTGTRYVRGRHRAGGQSQRRFERNREKWVRELFDEVCDVCRSRLGPYADDLDHLALGGDRHVLAQFLARCEWFAAVADRLLPSRVPVRRPGLAALRRSAEAVWSSHVHVRHA